MENLLIGVSSRFIDAKNLYEYGFANFSKQIVFKKGDYATQVEVANGTSKTKDLNLIIDKDVSGLISNDISLDDINPEISLNENISAPINEGDVLGTIKCSIDELSFSANLVASHSVEESKILNYVIYISSASIFIFLICEISSKFKKRNRVE